VRGRFSENDHVASRGIISLLAALAETGAR
jgi:hypothetical protein